MKKIFVVGMVVLSASFASAAGVAKSPRELLVDYTKQAKEHVYGTAGSAKGLNGSALNSTKETLLKHLEMPAMTGKLRPALSGKSGAERMDSLVTIIAAKKMSVEIGKKDAAEGQSIESAANASVKLIANADTVGAKASKDLSKEEASLVGEALTKAEALPTRILTEFSKAERDSYTQVIEKYDQLNQSGSSKSAEDNFVQAIMEVKKVDRTKALEIARKLKECV
ncbi:hypothetical protein QJS83_08890 [Bdellovibrio sp. 22V]|uniref:hypothetical protein n=1 Tax=Bdellovibrio TaxID=958 RepID=UPI0025428E76|nr:hypothetical protein [Bdellovibrio sp. 22V]WII70572.1 hypothetical protein QJS83_08890 [Bdellovibrio sp. 22V]